MSDADDTTRQWPSFTIVKFSEPTGIPNGWDSELLRKGVPHDLLGAYEVVTNLRLQQATPNAQPLVCFGTYGPSCSICLSPLTGEVVEVVDIPSGPIWLVNTSLDSFNAAVRAIVNRFPFDGENLLEEQGRDMSEFDWDPVADELISLLQEIDPASVATPDGFWMAFVDDVRMGDFSTEIVLSDVER